MLVKLDRKKVFDGLKPILKVKDWTQQQVAGLDRLLDGFERDALIPDGKVGVQRAAYYIYTDWIETARTFTPIKEYGGPAYYIRRYGAKTKKGKELGNDTDQEAVLYAGAGDVQLTGEDNFEEAEDMLRAHYADIVAEWEAATGKIFDLTVGDQPDDEDDVKNALYPAFSYAIMVGGTTLGLFGPPINRFINERTCKYGEARRCVNGTDRKDEFELYCPRIEKLLSNAVASTEQSTVVETAPVEGSTTTIENAGAVNLTGAISTVAPAAVEGGGANDPTVKVTSGSGSWIRSVLAWMGTIFTSASAQFQTVTGMSPEAQKYLIIAVIVGGALYLILKCVSEWQIRNIASDPTKQNVK